MKKILVLNSGSSSIKVKLFDKSFNVILEALIERIGVDGIMTIEYKDKKEEFKNTLPNHKVALEIFIKYLKNNNIINNFDEEIEVIGHRVVMGGSKYSNPTIVTKEVLDEIKTISHLAPLHNPANILGVEEMQKITKQPNVMIFDTAFHQTIKSINYIYPLPYELYEKHLIRKYGMHGTSYQYNMKKFIEEEKIQKPNLIIFHLGNGSSVCSIKEGKSIDTSMGMTPLAGLIMGTRCGDIDPAIPIFLQRELKISAKEVDEIMNKKSGLQGISGVSSDMRDVMKAMDEGNEKAKLAYDILVKKIMQYYSDYLNQLDNKLDGIIFTGGMGYNNLRLINLVVDKIKISNLKVIKDWKNNRSGWQKISDDSSQFKIYISDTNEELEIASQSLKIINEQ